MIHTVLDNQISLETVMAAAEDRDRTFGSAYSRQVDGRRVAVQMASIRGLMGDVVFRTLQDIEDATGYPQASISAQLRHLRKLRFGGATVEKRRVSAGLWAYRVTV